MTDIIKSDTDYYGLGFAKRELDRLEYTISSIRVSLRNCKVPEEVDVLLGSVLVLVESAKRLTKEEIQSEENV